MTLAATPLLSTIPTATVETPQRAGAQRAHQLLRKVLRNHRDEKKARASEWQIAIEASATRGGGGGLRRNWVGRGVVHCPCEYDMKKHGWMDMKLLAARVPSELEIGEVVEKGGARQEKEEAMEAVKVEIEKGGAGGYCRLQSGGDDRRGRTWKREV